MKKIHMLKSVSLVLMIAFTIPLQAQAIDYYVDQSNPSANDQNTGAIDRPWKTITKANQTLTAGDTVYIKAGTYSNYINPANSGAAGRYISYEGYGGTVTISGQAYGIRINGKNYIKVSGISGTNNTYHLYITGGSYNYVHDCRFIGGTTANYSANYWGSQIVNNSSYNRIDNCTFAQWGYQDVGGVFAIGTEESTTDTTQYNLVENSTFYSGAHHVFAILGRYNVIRNNLMYNKAWNPDGHRVIYLMGSTNSSFGIRNIVEGNRVGYAGISYDDGYNPNQLTAANYNIIRYNTYLKATGSGMAFDCGSAYPVAPSYNTVYNNTFYDNGKAESGDYYECAMDFNDWGHPGTMQGNKFKNNIFYSNGTPPCSYGFWGSSAANQTFAKNFADANGNPLFVSESGTDPASITLPNLNLQPSSPAIDFGSYLTQANGAGNNSKTLIVDDASYFQDGTYAPSGSINADWIAVGTVSNIVQISSVNYSTNTITLASPITWADNANIWLYKKSDGMRVLYGSAPDAGAYEFIQSAAPEAPKNLRIIN